MIAAEGTGDNLWGVRRAGDRKRDSRDQVVCVVDVGEELHLKMQELAIRASVLRGNEEEKSCLVVGNI